MTTDLECIRIVKTFADQTAYDAWVTTNLHGKPRAVKVSHATETMVLITAKDNAGASFTMPIIVGIWDPTSLGGVVTAATKMDGATNVLSGLTVLYGF